MEHTKKNAGKYYIHDLYKVSRGEWQRDIFKGGRVGVDATFQVETY